VRDGQWNTGWVRMSGVEACTDVRGFFRDHVTEALRSLDVKTEQATEHYLVNLLAGFAVSDRIHEMATPFVELLGKALAVSGPERVNRMRSLGDSALFVSGFLSDSCDRRGITQPYVIAIGARAYGEVGRVRRVASSDGGPAKEVFVELADRFEAFTRVLDEVREQTAMCTDGELVRLYERWCTTRSPKLFRRLHRRGVGAVKAKPARSDESN
jgi:hypothetical protein